MPYASREAGRLLRSNDGIEVYPVAAVADDGDSREGYAEIKIYMLITGADATPLESEVFGMLLV